jgi:hypothetical protein
MDAAASTVQPLPCAPRNTTPSSPCLAHNTQTFPSASQYMLPHAEHMASVAAQAVPYRGVM